ncbi:MAG: HAD family hydrolase [Epsilonproteobacteria bacterium]|nr:haloacid dehalogenase [Campylobacterota bacterium]NPA57478.1 HAD family hydrolase [Campylobacterota bacterium]
MKRYIIFDMDGTLVDSSSIIANSINYVRQKLGLPPMEKGEILRAVNDTSIHRPSFFYGVPEYGEDHISWFREYYREHHKSQTKLYPGIRELLEELRDRFDYALATNAYRLSADQILQHTGIDRYFTITVCGDEVERPKPAPDMIEKILREMGAKREEVVLVGDGKTDEEAARASGIPFIKVGWGWEENGGIGDVEELRERLLELQK